MSKAAAAIRTTAAHPIVDETQPMVKRPITFRLEASNRITAISGTASTPFMTALQNNAFIGVIGEY